MTKILSYTGQFKSRLLMDEIFEAFPEWPKVTQEGISRLHSKPDGTEVTLHAPDYADDAEIQAVIDAHDPEALSVGEQKEIHRADARARFLLSQLANKTPQEIYTQMQNRMNNWASLADARTDLSEWIPLLATIIAWKVMDQE